LRRGIDVLVATPGRLLDLIGQGLVDFKSVEVFVLDEADRMLDMGFIHDVKRVIERLPKKRQTLFFSATMPPDIARLADAILTDPAKVAVAAVSQVAERITQQLYFVEQADKRALLVYLLQDKSINRILVFTRTKHGANRLTEQLGKAGIHAEAIHGNKSQTARERALAGFKRGTVRALVATDIAARGIDIDELQHVVNFDLPEVPETYVHRIGRTARAGASGTAFAFCARDERDLLVDIERLMKLHIPVVAEHPSRSSVPPPAPTSLDSHSRGPRTTPPRQQQRPQRPHGGRPQHGRPAAHGAPRSPGSAPARTGAGPSRSHRGGRGGGSGRPRV
jgi:ATP-dependent RNA helicase RhlE